MAQSRRRAIPSDFLAIMPTMPRHELAKHYSTSYRVIRRWIEESGKPHSFKAGVVAHNRRPVPADWEQVAPTKTKTELAGHYRAGPMVVARWISETGIKAKTYIPTGNPNSLHRMGRVHSFGVSKVKVKSMFEEAADALRRERFPVNRCNEKGVYDERGEYWRVGWSVCTGDELLQRAARYGVAA